MTEGLSTKSLTTEQVFDLLGDGGRRRALSALWEANGAMSLGDLAATAVARAERIDPEDVTRDERERAAAALHHSHLPRLADAEAVEYDPVEGRVELAEAAAELRPYFEMVGDE